MNDYKELIEHLRNAGGGDLGIKMCYEAADAIEQLVRERDAAVADLKTISSCHSCIHKKEKYEMCLECARSSTSKRWQWRGAEVEK